MGRGPLFLSNIARSGRGPRAAYDGLIQHNCGAALLDRSVWFAVCKKPCYPALTSYFYLIDRRGHWLVWFEYP